MKEELADKYEVQISDENKISKYEFVERISQGKWVELSFRASIIDSKEFIIVSIIISDKQTFSSRAIPPFKNNDLQKVTHFFVRTYFIVGSICSDIFSLRCSKLLPTDLSNFNSLEEKQFNQNCLKGKNFDTIIRLCVKNEGNKCPFRRKEVVQTSECVEKCPISQVELNLQDLKLTSNDLSHPYLYCVDQFNNCKEGCKECDQSKEICFFCKSNYYFHLNKCLLKKEQQQQPLSYRMLAGGGTTNRCYLSYNQQVDCFTCFSPFVKVHSYCELCPRGTKPFSDGYSGTCLLLSGGCGDVNSSGVCITCFLGYHLNSGSCTRISSCSSSQYLGIDNSCHNCSEIANCSQCYSNAVCKVCNSGFHLQMANTSTSSPGIDCVSSCSVGYFLNSVTNYCSPCGYYCNLCTAETGLTCSNCQGSRVIDSAQNTLYPSNMQVCKRNSLNCDSQCIDCQPGSNICITGQCKQGSYQQGGDCIKCSNFCQTCSSTTTCSQCKGSAILSGGQCTLTCSGATYIDMNTTCASCPSNCSSCSNQETCDTCNPGYISLGGICAACPSNCTSCSNEFSCITCNSGYTLDIISNTCLINCLTNQYVSGASCHNCLSECTTCTSATVCTSCTSGYNLNISTCEIICSNGYYRNPSTNTCVLCTLGCSACTSNIICSSCIANYHLNSQSCDIICSTGYFRDSSSNSCLTCPSNCSVCSSSTICTTCNPSFTLNSSNQCQISSVCGDGQVLASILVSGVLQVKECDDQNAISGDGCSSNCQIESEYSCSYDGTKSVCQKNTYENDFTMEPKANLKDENPVINIIFDQPLKKHSSQSLISAIKADLSCEIETIESTKYTYELELNEDFTKITMTFTLEESVKNKQITIVFEDPLFISTNNILTDTKSCEFPDYQIIPEAQKATSQAIASVGSAIGSSIVASIIPIILFSNFQLLFQALDLFQMIFYLRFVDIRLPYNALVFIEIMKSFKLPFSIDFIEAILKEYPIEESHVPKSFTDGELGGVFLENAGEGLSKISILGGIHLVLVILSKLFQCIKNIRISKIGNSLARKLVESWELGWYLDVYWEIYLSLVVAGILQFYQIKFYDIQSRVNIICSFIIFTAVILTPFFFWQIIYFKREQLEEDQVKFKWGMLYESLVIVHNQNNDKKKVFPLAITHPVKIHLEYDLFEGKSFPLKTVNTKTAEPLSNQQTDKTQKDKLQETKITMEQSNSQNLTSLEEVKPQLSHNIPAGKQIAKYFYIALYFRKLSFGIFIAAFHEYPLEQLILFDLFNIILIVILITIKPYKSKLENIKSILSEILMLIAQVSFVFLINDGDDEKEESRLKIGWVFIFCCSGILILQFIFIFSSFVPPMIRKCKGICTKKSHLDENKKDDNEFLFSDTCKKTEIQQQEEVNQQIQIPLEIESPTQIENDKMINHANEKGNEKVHNIEIKNKKRRIISNQQFEAMFANSKRELIPTAFQNIGEVSKQSSCELRESEAAPSIKSNKNNIKNKFMQGIKEIKTQQPLIQPNNHVDEIILSPYKIRINNKDFLVGQQIGDNKSIQQKKELPFHFDSHFSSNTALKKNEDPQSVDSQNSSKFQFKRPRHSIQNILLQTQSQEKDKLFQSSSFSEDLDVTSIENKKH